MTRDRVRALDIARRRMAGETLQEIGDRYGITRERVRQICTKQRISPAVPRNEWRPIHYRRLAWAVYVAAERQRRLPGDPTFPHGELRGYRRGCKCNECREANRLRTYTTMGYTPKKPRPEQRDRLACLGCDCPYDDYTDGCPQCHKRHKKREWDKAHRARTRALKREWEKAHRTRKRDAGADSR